MRFIKILSISLAFLIIVLAAFSYWLFSSIGSLHEHEKADQIIQITKGSTPKQIIAKLADEGIIANHAATLIYLRTFGDSSKLQAGDYRFPSPITPRQVLKELENGQTRVLKLTIPEGFTRFDIAKRLAEWSNALPHTQGTTRATMSFQQETILKLMDDTTLIRDIAPEAKNLEGYMYPDTYLLDPSSTPEKLINAMVEQFKKVWKAEWKIAAQAVGRTPHEIVTIASLIETETSVESERPIVAGVIYNRLARNMALGIDQTNVYIAKMMGRWDGTIHRSDLDVDSPYNTRIKTGLPPGPISSVSESALNAAFFPASSEYLFYVLNVEANDGSHWFYSSAAEFEKGKAKYQQWLEKERQMKRAEQNTQ